MPPPEVLVTGNRHSGTTYVTRLLARWLDLGGPLHSISDRQGLEWVPLWEIAGAMATDLGRPIEPSFPMWTGIDPDQIRRVKHLWGGRLRDLDCPPLVKIPEYTGGVLTTLLRPGHVVLVHRPLSGWAASMDQNAFARRLTRKDRWYAGALNLGQILDQLATSQIPFTVVSYPALAQDPCYAYRALGPLVGAGRDEFVSAHNEVTDL